jgi:hypothetical protein
MSPIPDPLRFALHGDINAIVVCALLAEHIYHLVAFERHFVGAEETDTATLVPHEIISEPRWIAVDEVNTELRIAEHEDWCVIVATEAFDLNPELCEVQFDVPAAVSGGNGSLSVQFENWCSVKPSRELTVRQIAYEAINGFVRERFHDGEAVASQELMGHLLGTRRFLGIFILTPVTLQRICKTNKKVK